MVKDYADYLYDVDAFHMNSPREIHARVNMAHNAMEADRQAEKLRKTLDEMPQILREKPLEPKPLFDKFPYRK